MSGRVVVAICLASPLVFGAAHGSSARGETKPPESPRPSRIYVAADVTPQGGVLACDPETGEVEAISVRAELCVRVSPDRDRLAFMNDGALWTSTIHGPKEPVRVFDGGANGLWSPDGRALIVTTIKRPQQPGGAVTYEAIRMNADGSERVRLPLPASDYVQDWSSDGRWLATTSYRHRPGENRHIYVMHPDGKAERRLTHEHDNLYPRFSPDGRTIAFVRHVDGEKSLAVCTVAVQGGEPRKVYQIDGAHPSVCWSPNGKQLAVAVWNLSERGGVARDHPFGCRIELMDADGSHRTILPIPKASLVGPPDWR
jgi:dipeptidyl aminopeptidase/acylaminoacyl peptidase